MSIKFNLKKGTSIKIKADKVLEQGVEQNIMGGQLEHKVTKELTQVRNTMKVTKGGKIINEVTDGNLNQTDNLMEVDEESIIINKIKPDSST